jgi:hypothetical protein
VKDMFFKTAAVLASALEGFSQTPEFPEVEEAHTLLAELEAR